MSEDSYRIQWWTYSQFGRIQKHLELLKAQFLEAIDKGHSKIEIEIIDSKLLEKERAKVAILKEALETIGNPGEYGFQNIEQQIAREALKKVEEMEASGERSET